MRWSLGRAASASELGAERPNSEALAALPKDQRTTSETTAREVFDRLAGGWTYRGWKGGYFDWDADASAFQDELRYMLAEADGRSIRRNSFNTGLHGIGVDGPSQGIDVDHHSGELTVSKSACRHPQPHACFMPVGRGDLLNDGGIMDLWVREARLFKYGSGTSPISRGCAARRRSSRAAARPRVSCPF